MARIGVFHPEIRALAWFDETALSEAWFDRDNIDATAAPPSTFAPPFAGASPPRWAFAALFRAPPASPQSALGLLSAVVAAPPASFPPMGQISFMPQLMGR